MGKIKMQKKSTSIDMTAMCDVAFLLLTFFILTATAKVPEPLPGSARANCLSLIHELSPYRRGQRAARAVSLKRKMPTSDGGHFCFELLVFQDLWARVHSG